MDSAKDALNQATGDLTKAITADKAKNYESALELYKTGIKHLIEAKKFEGITTEQKGIIKGKCLQYLTRAEKIKG